MFLKENIKHKMWVRIENLGIKVFLLNVYGLILL